MAGDPHIRFYAGIPIRIGDCRRLDGAICVINTTPRTLSLERVTGLISLGEILEIHIQQKIQRLNIPAARPLGLPTGGELGQESDT